MEFVVTPSAEHLDVDARRLAPHPDDERRRFPDGEVYVQVPELDALEDVVVVHAGQPHPNRGLAYLHGVLALLADADCTTRLAFTYAPYGRQDAAFHPGTLNYARSLLRTVTRHYGVRRVYAVDPHFGHRDWARSLPFEALEAFPLVSEAVEMDDYVVVGPDLGAVERFGIPGFEKERESATSVALGGSLDVAGENVLVFDDMIATGGTMVAAFDRLREQGAKRVEAAAVHGVLTAGVERVSETYDALYLTNTVASDRATVGVEPLLESVRGE
jgi:ribose-phosphate pyrophosphokinase